MGSEQQAVPTEQLSRAFANTRAVLAKVGPDQLGAATPCTSWDVRALINHFIGTARWAAAAISAGEESTDADPAAGDFLASYDDSIQEALAAFGADGALAKTVELDIGELTGVALVTMISGDQFMHGWDLARAIGYPTDLDPELAGELLVQARVQIPDALRGPDGVAPFGPAIEAPAGVSPADQLAAFLGRSL